MVYDFFHVYFVIHFFSSLCQNFGQIYFKILINFHSNFQILVCVFDPRFSKAVFFHFTQTGKNCKSKFKTLMNAQAGGTHSNNIN